MAPVIAWTAEFLMVTFAGAGYGVLSASAIAGYEAVATALVYIGGNYALTAASNALAPRPKGLRGHDVEYSGTVEPRRIVYGTFRVSGQNVIPAITSGTEGQYLHQVLAVAGHECASINTVYLGQAYNVVNAEIGSITGSNSDGVIGGVSAWKDYLWVRRYLGTAGQTVDYILDNAITDWDSNCRGRGVCYVALRYLYSDKKWQTGKPDITFLVEGKKVYDPRLDSSPGANPTNASYIAFSNNPALIAADYIMDSSLGLGDSASRIDWATVVASANICDESVSVPSPETTQKRYTCDTVLIATDRYEDNLEVIADSMMGHILYSSGKWYIYAGAWSSSAFTLTESDLVGAVSVKAELPRAEKWNAVKGQYYDAARNYQASEFSPRRTAAYESDDGELIWREVEFKACTNEYRAQRNAILLLRRSRRVRTVTAEYGLSAWKVRPFETGTVTITEIGWVAQAVRCTAWEFTPEGKVRLTFREEASADWADPTSPTDYGTAVAAITLTPGLYTPPAPTSLTATPVINGVLLSWTYGDLTPGTFFEVYRYSASTPFASATRIGTTTGVTFVDAGTDGKDWFYWVRAAFANGNTSATEPASAGVQASRVVVEVVPDPDFALSTTDGLYWAINATGTQTGTISLTGGVSTGKFSTTLVSASSAYNGTTNSYSDYVALTPVRPLLPTVTGTVYEAVVRWRRTGTIAGSQSGMEVVVGTAPSSYTPGSPSGFTYSVAGYPEVLYCAGTRGPLDPRLFTADLNAYTVNEWQELRVQYRVKNVGKSSTQQPYLVATLRIGSDTSASGTIEIDSFSVARVLSDVVYKDALEIGYREAPINTQDATYTFALTDNGRTVRHTSASAHTWTIDTNANVAFPIGTIIAVEAGSASGNVTIAPAGGVTLEWAGTASTGSRTLAANGLGSLLKTATNTWKIGGVGIS